MSILVTGASRGLGKAIAGRLTQMGKTVVAVTRDGADLSRMDEVGRLAKDIASRHPDLEVLINNAGVSKFTREVTRDGFETTFAGPSLQVVRIEPSSRLGSLRDAVCWSAGNIERWIAQGEQDAKCIVSSITM